MPYTSDTFIPEPDPNDDLDARIRHIRSRILDGIESTLDTLMSPDAPRRAIAESVAAHVAPLFCPRATCRRAGRCRAGRCRSDSCYAHCPDEAERHSERRS